MKSAILFVAALLAACSAIFSACNDHTCLRESDCSQAQACVMGSCTLVAGSDEASVTDAGSLIPDANSTSPIDDTGLTDTEAGDTVEAGTTDASDDDADGNDVDADDGSTDDASGAF